MLEINVKAGQKETFDDNKNEFVNFVLDHDYKIILEHSLVSISKWESKWHKPFLSTKNKSDEEIMDYIICMIITPNIPNDIIYFLSKDDLKKINDYIDNPMTATTFHSHGAPNETTKSPTKKNETITNEIIYYWMIENEIPVEFQKWHLNRLLTLIRVCNIKNNSNNKMNKKDTLAHQHSLNQARRAKHGIK